MNYSTDKDGNATFTLDREEHTRFKKGQTCVKWTASTHGEFHIVVKMIKIKHPYICTYLLTGEEKIIYANSIKNAIRAEFGVEIASHHGYLRGKGQVVQLHNGNRYALKRKLQPK